MPTTLLLSPPPPPRIFKPSYCPAIITLEANVVEVT
jgi:hypothetical protein